MQHYSIFHRDALLRCVLALVVVSLAWAAPAQYQLFHLSDFESGALPENSAGIGNSFASAVGVVDYTSIPGMVPEFREGRAATEVGRHGLRITSHPEYWMSGLATGIILDRDAIGQRGRALYQADFFIPGTSDTLPNIAVLAMVPLQPGETRPNTFYRFGITKNSVLYFSRHTLGETTTQVYHQDATFISKLRRPGWHRFAIVFEGAEIIRCYVDGQELPFNPIRENTLRQLQVGIMLVDITNAYDAYIDNISIQWTEEDVPLPDSPWVEPSSVAPTASSGAFQVSSPEPAMGHRLDEISWYDPATGWALANSTQRSMLAYFMAPRIATTQELDQIFLTDSAARAYVQQFVPVRIDVNQLQGGQIAGNLNITRVPTIVIFNPDGTEGGRATFTTRNTWETFRAQLP